MIRQYVERHGRQTLLPFSRGKDSIATALAIRDKLDVTPLFYEIVPGLPFVEESLDYYERKLFGRKILRLPHPSLNRQLNEFLYQPVGNAEVIAACGLEELDYPDINRMAIEKEGLREDVLAALGVRMHDNQLRRATFFKFGAIRETRRSWFPVWNWSKGRLVDEIRRSGISLPVDYLIWGRSWDGLGYQYLVPMKKFLPNDYAKVLELFPLAEVEVFRYEAGQKADARKGGKARR